MAERLANGQQTKIQRNTSPNQEDGTSANDHMGERLLPYTFTKHMEAPTQERWAPPITAFEPNEQWETRIKKAIQRAPRNKATGTDEIFVEALRVDPNGASKAICQFWRICLQMHYVPVDWRTAVLIPIYKKGAKSEPGSYRPIALLSHVRKVIEAAVAMPIREDYKFSSAQLASDHG